jgi:hypothetical protein
MTFAGCCHDREFGLFADDRMLCVPDLRRAGHDAQKKVVSDDLPILQVQHIQKRDKVFLSGL